MLADHETNEDNVSRSKVCSQNFDSMFLEDSSSSRKVSTQKFDSNSLEDNRSSNKVKKNNSMLL